MDVTVNGATLAKQGLRIFVHPEKDGVLEAGTDLEVTDVSETVQVPVSPSTTTLTVLVVNGSIEHDVATVTFGKGFPRISMGYSTYTFLCTAPGGCSGAWCGIKAGENGPGWAGPVTWTGNSFVLQVSETRITGELSADRKVLLSYKYEIGPQTWIHWVNLPLDAARTTATQLVFAASGQAAAQHIVTAYPMICSSTHSGIDYAKPVLIELWLGP
jgi:hypothetical protein